MRKIVESTLVSLDGVFGDPHVWATEYFDREAEAYALDLLSASDAMLMGRGTYEFLAGAFPHQTGEYGRRINTIRKHVFSNTLTRADWSHSSIVRGDVVAEAAKLKQAGGGDLVMYGHGRLGRTLLEATFSTRSSCGSIRCSGARARCSSAAGGTRGWSSSARRPWAPASSS